MKRWTRTEYRIRGAYDRALERFQAAPWDFGLWEHYKHASTRLGLLLELLEGRP